MKIRQIVTLTLIGLLVFLAGTALAADTLKPKKIKVDKNLMDWTGVAPEKENTSCISNNEFIWKDAKGDDTGNGRYNYPPNPELAKGSDLLEFRVAYDAQNVYFLIKCTRPANWWVPYRLIGISKVGLSGGMSFFPQGDSDILESAGGCFGELRTGEGLPLHRTIAIFGTYKGYVWDDKGKCIAKKLGEKGDTQGFMVDDDKWSTVEVAVPLYLIGNPAGQTWKIIVAVGQEETNHMREVYGEATEWHAGGGEGKDNEDGVDPDVFDLVSPSREIQEKELGSYNTGGQPGDIDSFAVISQSYIIVNFAK